MRIRPIALPLFLLLCLSPLVRAAEPTYFLALGDSLSVGLQPSRGGDVPTNQGYVDDLYAVLRARVPKLSLEKLGCSGETTQTMITGGLCSYADGSQLAAAEDFLKNHDVKLVTIDIGANDVDQCFNLTTLTINEPCVAANLTTIPGNLSYILWRLRTANPSVPIVAMNYYDAFLAAAKLLPAPEGPALAQESLALTDGGPASLNGVLESVYQVFGVPVADVAAAFRINETATIPIIKLPVNVFVTLTFTWMAAPAPLGPDIHPNAAGYAAIAAAFLSTIAGL
jgi:lysophospholipase L1-like esterase